MGKKVVRLTESEFQDIISEQIFKILMSEGAWANFAKGFNAKGLLNYAKSRIIDGHDAHDVGEDSDENKRRKAHLAAQEHLNKGGKIDTNGDLV